jgi:hypothetical protein
MWSHPNSWWRPCPGEAVGIATHPFLTTDAAREPESCRKSFLTVGLINYSFFVWLKATYIYYHKVLFIRRLTQVIFRLQSRCCQAYFSFWRFHGQIYLRAFPSLQKLATPLTCGPLSCSKLAMAGGIFLRLHHSDTNSSASLFCI